MGRFDAPGYGRGRAGRGRHSGRRGVGFGPGRGGANLSPTGDLAEAAAQLFALLRDLDDKAAPDQIIAVAPIPDEGLGQAINDRLRRAAAERN